jgi:hypothetical protein
LPGSTFGDCSTTIGHSTDPLIAIAKTKSARCRRTMRQPQSCARLGRFSDRERDWWRRPSVCGA